MHNESVRDSVFRYCPEDKTDFLSMNFCKPKSQSVMDSYRRHEAQLMIETLTKDSKSKKEKIVKIISNFRSDSVFAETAFKFLSKEFFGEKGPIRLK